MQADGCPLKSLQIAANHHAGSSVLSDVRAVLATRYIRSVDEYISSQGRPVRQKGQSFQHDGLLLSASFSTDSRQLAFVFSSPKTTTAIHLFEADREGV